jgi:hypothetical protein
LVRTRRRPGTGWWHATVGRPDIRTVRNSEPLTKLVQAKRIRERHAIEPRLSCLVRIEDLVKDPRGDKNAEQRMLIRNSDQYHEDQYMDQRFDELAVVHGAHSGNKSENESQAGIRTF